MCAGSARQIEVFPRFPPFEVVHDADALGGRPMPVTRITHARTTRVRRLGIALWLSASAHDGMATRANNDSTHRG